MKTLVVDDETVSREKMSRIMRCFGPTTDAPDGIQAIKAFSDAWEKWDPFDLIMLDFSMKGMDGLQVLKTIRGLEKNKKPQAQWPSSGPLVSVCHRIKKGLPPRTEGHKPQEKRHTVQGENRKQSRHIKKSGRTQHCADRAILQP